MVYAIFSGAYSDWHVHGYFTNPDDAYAFCEFHNNNKDEYDEYYVVPIEEMTIDFNERPNFHYKFAFYALVNDGVVEEILLDEVYTAPGGMCPNNSIDKMKIYNFLRYSVKIYMKDYDYEKAYKIACDMIYQKVAEDLRL